MPDLQSRTTERALGQNRETNTTYQPTTRTDERGERTVTRTEDVPDIASSSTRTQADSTTTQVRAENTVTSTQNQHYAVAVSMRIPFQAREPITPSA